MICSNCFNDEYQTTTISKDVTVNGVIKTIHDIECEQCPSCKDIIFTHQQSLELDKIRKGMSILETDNAPHDLCGQGGLCFIIVKLIT